MDATTEISSRRIDELLNHYAQSHRHPTNEGIHFAAIPLIMLSLIGLMFCLHPLVAFGLFWPAWFITCACRWCLLPP